MQSETHNPKHFLENVYKADFGRGGTLKLTCKGIVGRSNTLPNQIRQGEPSGGAAEATTLSYRARHVL